jgi:hypothetical protein
MAQTTGDNRTHAHCMMDNSDYSHALTYSIATMVTQNVSQCYVLRTLPVVFLLVAIH